MSRDRSHSAEMLFQVISVTPHVEHAVETTA
jgi:hypothetical protein